MRFRTTISIGLFVFICTASIASAWLGPPYGGTCSQTPCPPNGNTPAPVNVGSISQTRVGTLILGNSTPGTGLLWVNGLTVAGNTLFDGELDPTATTSTYLNFSNLASPSSGFSGYGFWDNNGTLEFKNSGGSWQPFSSGGGSSQWTNGTGGAIYYNGGNVGINKSSPGYTLDVGGTINASTQVISPQYCISASCITSWTSNSDTLDTVTGRGNVTTNPITIGGLVIGANDHSSTVGNFSGIGFNSYFNSSANSWYDYDGSDAGFIYINPNTGTMNFWLGTGTAGSALSSAIKPLQLDTGGNLTAVGNMTAPDYYDAAGSRWVSTIGRGAQFTQTSSTITGGATVSCPSQSFMTSLTFNYNGSYYTFTIGCQWMN